MLQLDESLFIGRGADKNCYLHPEDRNLCIKVPKRPHGRMVIEKDLAQRERLAGANILPPFIPAFFGTVETSVGTGYVYELVSDSDGAVSRSLAQHMRSDSLSEREADDLARSMRAVRDFIFGNLVILKDPKEANFLVRRTASGCEAVYVDDLGSEVFFPAEYYVRFLRRLKIRRKWVKLVNDTRRHPDSRLAGKIREAIRLR